MKHHQEDFEGKPKAKFNPAIIIVAVVLVIAILLIIWFATRNPKANASVVPAGSTAIPVASASPTAGPATASGQGEWTSQRLEDLIKANTPIHFVKDSTRLLAGEQAKVEAIAAALVHYKNIQLRFRGHTADYNLKKFQYELSLLRASGVRWMLEYRAGDDISSVTVQGAGSREPVSPGNSEAQRAPNRRVEIVLQHAEPK